MRQWHFDVIIGFLEGILCERAAGEMWALCTREPVTATAHRKRDKSTRASMLRSQTQVCTSKYTTTQAQTQKSAKQWPKRQHTATPPSAKNSATKHNKPTRSSTTATTIMGNQKESTLELYLRRQEPSTNQPRLGVCLTCGRPEHQSLPHGL